MKLIWVSVPPLLSGLARVPVAVLLIRLRPEFIPCFDLPLQTPDICDDFSSYCYQADRRPRESIFVRMACPIDAADSWHLHEEKRLMAAYGIADTILRTFKAARLSIRRRRQCRQPPEARLWKQGVGGRARPVLCRVSGSYDDAAR